MSLTGTANTVTAAQATSLAALAGFALASGATLVVADTAANLLASGNAAGIAKATSVIADRHRQHVTAAQATSLACPAGFGLASGATLAVADNAANLLASGNVAGIAKATTRAP